MTFAEFLKETKADSDTIQQALRLHLSERTDDLAPAEMQDELRTAANDLVELEKQLKGLEENSAAIKQAALAYFDHAWNDEAQQASIRAAFKHAKAKLPVIETAILGIVAMYAMYLIVTEGVTEEVEEEFTKPDGTRGRRTKKKREPFAPVGALVTKLFGNVDDAGSRKRR
jgi:hypothetical protein